MFRRLFLTALLGYLLLTTLLSARLFLTPLLLRSLLLTPLLLRNLLLTSLLSARLFLTTLLQRILLLSPLLSTRLFLPTLVLLRILLLSPLLGNLFLPTLLSARPVLVLLFSRWLFLLELSLASSTASPGATAGPASTLRLPGLALGLLALPPLGLGLGTLASRFRRLLLRPPFFLSSAHFLSALSSSRFLSALPSTALSVPSPALLTLLGRLLASLGLLGAFAFSALLRRLFAALSLLLGPLLSEPLLAFSRSSLLLIVPSGLLALPFLTALGLLPFRGVLFLVPRFRLPARLPGSSRPLSSVRRWVSTHGFRARLGGITGGAPRG